MIEVLRGRKFEVARLWADTVAAGTPLFYSPVTPAEVRHGTRGRLPSRLSRQSRIGIGRRSDRRHCVGSSTGVVDAAPKAFSDERPSVLREGLAEDAPPMVLDGLVCGSGARSKTFGGRHPQGFHIWHKFHRDDLQARFDLLFIPGPGCHRQLEVLEIGRRDREREKPSGTPVRTISPAALAGAVRIGLSSAFMREASDVTIAAPF